MPNQYTSAPFAERFWSYVDRTDGCWQWTQGRNRDGYGFVSVHGRWLRAHRVAWELVNGPIPNGLFVLHHCDTPPCVRPDHLFIGTAADNAADMIAKGRAVLDVAVYGDQHWTRLKPERLARGERNGNATHPEKRPRGESHHKAKLKAEQVREIRSRHAAGESQCSLGREFGISQHSVWGIVHRITWRQL